MRRLLSRLVVLLLVPALAAAAAPVAPTPAEKDRSIREGCAAAYAFRYLAEPESPRGRVAQKAANAVVDDIIARHGGDRPALVKLLNGRAYAIGARLSEPEQKITHEQVARQILDCDAYTGQAVAKAWTPKPGEEPNLKGWGADQYGPCASLYIAFARRGDDAVKAKVATILDHETRRIGPYWDRTLPETASFILLGANRIDEAMKTGRYTRQTARETLATCDIYVGWHIPDPNAPTDAVCIRISNAAIDEINARSKSLPKNADKYTLGGTIGRNCATARNGLFNLEQAGCNAAQSQIVRDASKHWEAELERLNSSTLSDFACRNW